MNDIPLGTIVRVLSVNGNPRAMGPDAWGVVVYDPMMPTTSWRICVYAFKRQACHEGYNVPHNGHSVGWYLQGHEYEIVPDDEVPNHIWAALAEARLTQ